MSKHTPGPWAIEQSSRTDIYIIAQSIEAKNKWVATACNHEFHPTEEGNTRNQANARLIAAAPELLEALQEAVDELRVKSGKYEGAALKLARAAIARATGGEDKS